MFYSSYRQRLGLGRDLFELINCAGTFTAIILLLVYLVSLCHQETYKNVRHSLFVSSLEEEKTQIKVKYSGDFADFRLLCDVHYSLSDAEEGRLQRTSLYMVLR